MTFRAITVEGLDDANTEVLNRLRKQLYDKTPRNLLRASYYDGKHAVRQVGSVIPPQYYRLAIVLGWSAKAVDILARRCNLDALIWPGKKMDRLRGSEWWEGNNFGAEISSAMIESLIHGVSFLINTQGDTDEGELPSLVHVKNALNATGEWNARKRALDNLLSVTERDEKGNESKFVLYLPGEIIEITKDSGRWSVSASSTHSWGVPAEPLVYKPRAGRPFGTSRISRAVMSLHDQALRTVIRLEGHMDIYSFPEFWVLGASESDFKNPDGSLKTAWQVLLGRIKALGDDDEADDPSLARADVKHFPASNPTPHLSALKQQAQLFSGETSIPLTSLGVSDMSNPTSADSYIASREDLIAEAEGATDDWTPAVKRCALRGLAMHNGRDEVPESWKTIEPKWRSPLYLSRAAAADAGAKIVATVPWLAETEVGLRLLGLDEQQARQALAERPTTTMPPTPDPSASDADTSE